MLLRKQAHVPTKWVTQIHILSLLRTPFHPHKMIASLLFTPTVTNLGNASLGNQATGKRVAKKFCALHKLKSVHGVQDILRRLQNKDNQFLYVPLSQQTLRKYNIWCKSLEPTLISGEWGVQKYSLWSKTAFVQIQHTWSQDLTWLSLLFNTVWTFLGKVSCNFSLGSMSCWNMKLLPLRSFTDDIEC